MSRLNLRPNRVQSSFKTLQRRLLVIVRKVNAEAAAQMKAGRYDTAKGLMEIGRSLSEFTAKTEDVSRAWDQLATQTTTAINELGIQGGTSPKKVTSAKALCIPALRIVVKRGGHAEMSDVLSELGNHGVTWTDADLAQSAGTLRWHLTLDKAYRRSQRLGWLEKRGDGTWEITDKGRSAVEQQSAE